MVDDPSAKPPLLLHQHGRGEMHRGGPPGESVSARTLAYQPLFKIPREYTGRSSRLEQGR